jgi:hypothetical protein
MSAVQKTIGGVLICRTGVADADQVEPGVVGTRRIAMKVGQDGGQFEAGQDLRGIDANRLADVDGVAPEF